MKNNKGFSLVELIVVIAIMAILAAVAVASFSIYIKRSNDAVDFDYLSKLTYLAEIYAIEHQLGLESVVVSEGGVSKPEDIALWIIDPATGKTILYSYPENEDLIEIYNAIGNWEFKGEGFKEATDFIPDFSGGDLDDSNNGNHDASHVNITIDKQEPTCKYSGWEKLSCETCGMETVNVLPATGIHKYSNTPTHKAGKYEYFICTYDGCSQVKIMSTDGSVIVPIK